MAGGAPLGNKNAARGKIWTHAIERALERRKVEGVAVIDALADKLIDVCMDGDITALKELGDRLQGKAAQAIVGGGEDDPPVTIRRIELVALRAPAPRMLAAISGPDSDQPA